MNPHMKDYRKFIFEEPKGKYKIRADILEKVKNENGNAKTLSQSLLNCLFHPNEFGICSYTGKKGKGAAKSKPKLDVWRREAIVG